MYEVKEANSIFVFKSRTHFGGGKSTLIYDSVDNAKKTDSILDTNVEKLMKQMKERKIPGVNKLLILDSFSSFGPPHPRVLGPLQIMLASFLIFGLDG
ncbi:hypothetical protein V6N12_058475 [Hibiscus sabdariffa]|uniref:Uncharacterized protein n=1 Tax=Hibiscus sabdariffa TaxID=183260 RepID=A0ABR2ES91_9ROSI